MKRYARKYSGAAVGGSVFEAAGGVREVHLCVELTSTASLNEALECLAEALQEARDDLALPDDSAVFQRLFVSDYANQREAIEGSRLFVSAREQHCAFSIIQQPPVPNRKACLWAYFLCDGAGLSKKNTDLGLLVERNGLVHAWTVGRTADPGTQTFTSDAQTNQIFDRYIAQLKVHGGTLQDHVIRTWLFVHDVDLNYQGMVARRKAIFADHGMTKETHYIASTGIEGRHADPRRLVVLDSYAILGLDDGQIRFLSARNKLGPTSDYGVTFERGVKVQHGDRSHVFISGTASIDPQGKTLHVSDIKAQVVRTMDNIDALLQDARASGGDIAQLIVYLRDPADAVCVRRLVEDHYPRVPLVAVVAPVCRPQWLVEIECTAIVDDGDGRFGEF